ncbi:hypothetical protein H2199_002895 [Coniosporium tulheliwenetii]|uniref:Uncharacterized protein n=1 Tax=Coniosporium tulheliwenetii TaxID=3383036 RepID=A0ACC2ZDG3_9PEZI|nr:hypothetical protein H2199_002895 [Cladosporium sp. JES 115]
MPRVLSYTPSWLSRPSPGFDLFAQSPAKNKTKARVPNGNGSSSEASGPRRTIARRGTEVFVAVGNEIRWSDLVLLKEKGASDGDLRRSRSSRRRGSGSDAYGNDAHDDDYAEGAYRVLKVPVYGPITQLIISPREDYIAIVTSHTVHIAVLPDSSHLSALDSGPLKLKAFHLGPTTHVLEQAPIASVLWHPLGYQGRCLVTITKDAVVRLWEINREDRWSFDNPALAIDLKKLANATSAEEDVQASTYGAGKGFSPDSVELEVASACFGGSGQLTTEYGWVPMTLWLAMTEGDVYALCPLLPNKWEWETHAEFSPYMHSLSLAIGAKLAMVSSDEGASDADTEIAEQQLQWISGIQDQNVLTTRGELGQDIVEVFTRPSKPGAVPKLQGPFQFDPEIEDDFEISDIRVIGLTSQDSDYDHENWEPGLPGAVVCLLTNNGKVHICLELDGIEGQWLPTGRNTAAFQDDGLLQSLTVLETIVLTSEPSDAVHASFTADMLSQELLFVTYSSGVHSLSLSPWLARLKEELANPSDEGALFRLSSLLSSTPTLVERPLRINPEYDTPAPIPAAIVLQDSDLGYLLLTSTGSSPVAALLEPPLWTLDPSTRLPDHPYEPDAPRDLQISEPRSAYQPPAVFYRDSALPKFIEQHVPAHRRPALKDEIKLSPATLDLLSQAHRILAAETHALGLAAADLFRRCERLVSEFGEQIARVAEVADRIERVTGEDEEEGDEEGDGAVGLANERIERRIERVRKVEGTVDEGWWEGVECEGDELGGEVESVAREVLAPEGEERSGVDREREGEAVLPWQRVEEVRRLVKDLVAQAKEAANEPGDTAAVPAVRVPSDFRKAKVAQVRELLDRETALVEAATEKLDRLSIAM